MCTIVISHTSGKKDLYDLTIRGRTVTLPYQDMVNLANMSNAAVRENLPEKVYAYYDCKGATYELP